MNKHLDIKFKEHIINLYDRNYKVYDIANIYQITPKTVYNIINRSKTNTLERKKGSGGNFDENVWNKIKSIIDHDKNLSLSQISNKLDEEHDIKCSKSAVRRHLIKNNYILKNPIVKPLLTEDIKNDREYWAIFYQKYDWESVIWSDEILLKGYT